MDYELLLVQNEFGMRFAVAPMHTAVKGDSVLLSDNEFYDVVMKAFQFNDVRMTEAEMIITYFGGIENIPNVVKVGRWKEVEDLRKEQNV